jgi:subtilase family serine protease
VIFSGSNDPVDLDTSAASAGATSQVAVNIPNSCFNSSLQCAFTIGVDATNAVAESNETNNNVAGMCGPSLL